MRRRHLAVEPGQRRPFVDTIEEARQLEVGKRALIAERARELGLAVDDAGKPADELDPDPRSAR